MPLSYRNLSEWLDGSLLLRPTVLWTAVGLVVTCLIAGAGSLAWSVIAGPRPPPFRSAASPPVSTARSDRLLLAGSGSNVPLTRLLAADCTARHPDLRIIVDEGMGSTGGLRALADGAIDLALISRPLRPAEERRGFQTFPYARTPVAVAAHPSVPDDNVTPTQLLAIFGGIRNAWPDGQSIVPLLREHGDSSHEAVARGLPAFAATQEAAWQHGKLRVLYHDRSMHEALLATPGAIGLVDAGAVRALDLPVKLLRVDGVAPNAAEVAAGRYPFWKDLAFVALTRPVGLAARFLACVASPESAALIRRTGGLPLSGATLPRPSDQPGKLPHGLRTPSASYDLPTPVTPVRVDVPTEPPARPGIPEAGS